MSTHAIQIREHMYAYASETIEQLSSIQELKVHIPELFVDLPNTTNITNVNKSSTIFINGSSKPQVARSNTKNYLTIPVLNNCIGNSVYRNQRLLVLFINNNPNNAYIFATA